MYFENEKDYSRRRSGDEFLRRMKSEEFLSRMSAGRDIPTFNREDERTRTNSIPRNDEPPRTSCNGDEPLEFLGSFRCETNHNSYHMPSLAMVYSPLQGWQNLLTPQDGLVHGSIFAELIKPFEGTSIGRGTEGGCCK